MLSRSSYRITFILAISLMSIAAVSAPTLADETVTHVRIVRLSFVEGDVAFQSAGSTWQRAMMNLPIRQGLSLRTDAGYAEVEFETGLIVHLAGNTQLEFVELSTNDGIRVTSLKLDHGTMIATSN